MFVPGFLRKYFTHTPRNSNVTAPSKFDPEIKIYPVATGVSTDPFYHIVVYWKDREKRIVDATLFLDGQGYLFFDARGDTPIPLGKHTSVALLLRDRNGNEYVKTEEL